MMLVGIPNVGKSSLANALHKIGRISATEKGKLKHAVVSPLPGETKSINSLKVASHPNIYVLDTPSIFPQQIIDPEVSAKLSLTGALKDILAGKELAQYFLSLLNSSYEYQKWEKLSTHNIPVLMEHDNIKACKGGFETNRMPKEELLTDHTKDWVVRNVRRSLFESISSFSGNLEDEEDMLRLIEAEFRILRKAFNVPPNLSEVDSDYKVGVKLLNLYRTGRLGHYTLDRVP